MRRTLKPSSLFQTLFATYIQFLVAVSCSTLFYNPYDVSLYPSEDKYSERIRARSDTAEAIRQGRRMVLVEFGRINNDLCYCECDITRTKFLLISEITFFDKYFIIFANALYHCSEFTIFFIL